MKIAIMQPYFLPYIGYFQLIKAVDKFVLYDDVNYINKGWINRNNLLVNGKAFLFTVPLKDASQNKLINQIELSDDPKWRPKLLQTVGQSYKKAPYFAQVYPIVERILHNTSPRVADLIFGSIQEIMQYLAITTDLVRSSAVYGNEQLKAQDRIIDICRQENAKLYINPIGGQQLYNYLAFDAEKITLRFIKTNPLVYKQFQNEYVPFLSVLDILMFNSVAEVNALLDLYELVA